MKFLICNFLGVNDSLGCLHPETFGTSVYLASPLWTNSATVSWPLVKGTFPVTRDLKIASKVHSFSVT